MENNTNIYINNNNCMCRKNKTNGLFLQCNNKRKFGLYCGKHHTNKWKLKSPQSYVSMQNGGKSPRQGAQLLEKPTTASKCTPRPARIAA